jgi:hypothetical protein
VVAVFFVSLERGDGDASNGGKIIKIKAVLAELRGFKKRYKKITKKLQKKSKIVKRMGNDVWQCWVAAKAEVIWYRRKEEIKSRRMMVKSSKSEYY